ncbi:DNA topoisomerase IV [Algoriphagus pacificus]|uniref:DNA topoisomerase IV n=1 Tax=Algoriphagus pacificus TaxID=2811234 RepID=A0ABS3CHK6_9BACT|nr:DNA topoisomerase IV [Algoriphagus pacificus]MBN7816576.1 DNA topoisomerase IV [Algoriphagus pacificus]
MYYRFGKAFYFLSILFFVFYLLYFYSALPEKISFSQNEEGNLLTELSRGTFFYGMIAVFVLFNAINLLPPKLLETKNHRGLVRLFPVGDKFRDYYLGWFYSFGGILNVSLALLIFYTHAVNNQDDDAPQQFDFLFYIIPTLFVIWIIGLFAIMVGKFKQVQNKS